MRNIFTRQEGLENEVTNILTYKNQDYKTACKYYMPLYYIESGLDKDNIYKVAKCSFNIDGIIVDELIEVESPFGEIGHLYLDVELKNNIDEITTENTIKNLLSIVSNVKNKNIADFEKMRQSLFSIIDKYFYNEKKKLSNDELIDFNIELNACINKNSIQDLIELKQKYVQIANNKKSTETLYLPLFFVLDDDFKISTVSLKCYKNERDEINLINEYILTRNFNKENIGNVFKDKDLTEIVDNYNIVKRLKNLNDALEFTKKTDLKIDFKEKYYSAGSETESSIYRLAQNWLSQNNDFINASDRENARLLIAQVSTLKVDQLIENIYKLKENIMYEKDNKTGLKIERKRKTSKLDSINLKGIGLSDIKITDC